MPFNSTRSRALTGAAGDHPPVTGARTRSLSTASTAASAAAAGPTAAPAGRAKGARGGSGSRRPRALVLPPSRRKGEFDAFKESLLDTLGRTDLRAIDEGLRGLSSRDEGDLMLGGSSVFSDDEEDSDDSDSDGFSGGGGGGGGKGNGSESDFSAVSRVGGGGGGSGGVSVSSSGANGGGGPVADGGWPAEGTRWNSLGDGGGGGGGGGGGNRNSKGRGKAKIANNGKTTAARRAVAEQQAPSTSSIVAAAMIRRSASAASSSSSSVPSSSAPSSSKRRSKREGGGAGAGAGGKGGGSRHKAGVGAGKKRGAGGGRGGGGGREGAGVAAGVAAPLQQLARVSTDGVDGDDSDSDRDVPWAVIKVRSETEIIRCLDPRFFVEDFDPITRILDDLPDLGHTSYSSSTAGAGGGGGGGRLSRRSSAGSNSGLSRTGSSGSVAIVDGVAGGEAAGACDEYLERQLRDMDVARLAVTTQIACMVQENYAALVGGMRQVQAVDLDMARVGVQISNGRRWLQRSLARRTGPVLRIVEKDRRRDRLRLLQAVTTSCLEAVAEEEKVEGELAAGRFTQAVATAELLSETLSADEQMSSLAVLGGVRERARSILPTVKTRAELAVSELCRTFSPEGYGGIVEAFLMLEDRGALCPLPPPPAPPPPPLHTKTEKLAEQGNETNLGEGSSNQDGVLSHPGLTAAGAQSLGRASRAGDADAGGGGVDVCPEDVADVVPDSAGAGGAAGAAAAGVGGEVEEAVGKPGQGRRRWISEGLANCPLPLPRSLLAPTGTAAVSVAVPEGATAAAAPAATPPLPQPQRRSVWDRSAVQSADGTYGDKGEAPEIAGVARAEEADAAVVGDTRTGMEMLSDHVLKCFVEEFNRLLADAIFEALLADQGLEAPERRRRGSRRVFEPPPALFLPAPQLLDGIVQICHGAAELLHSHFCCTQWHASAFDDRLEDDAFLHTANPLDSADAPAIGTGTGTGTGAGGDDGDGSSITRRDHGSSTGPRLSVAVESGAAAAGGGAGNGRRARAEDPRVRVLQQRLVHQRVVLWEDIEGKMVRLLSEATVGGGALELEDLAGVVGAVGLLAALGDEFVGDSGVAGKGSAGRVLRECLSGMAREFFQGANKEGVTVLKQMLEMEAWQRVPIPLKPEGGGVGALIDANAQRFCSPHRVYRGIRKPYLHLMHDVMSLEGEHEEEQGAAAGEEKGESRQQAFPAAHPTTTTVTTATATELETGAPTTADPSAQGLPPTPQPRRQGRPQRRQSLLREWHRRGNPFRMPGDNYAYADAASAAAGGTVGGATAAAAATAAGERREEAAAAAAATAAAGGVGGSSSGVGLGMLPEGTDVDDDPDTVVAVMGAAGGGGTVSNGGAGGRGRGGGRDDVRDEVQSEEHRYGSGWVVTQAALNGVARYAGHALQIMALVRPAAPSAFEGLRQLVDLYLYCSFTLFCPQWSIDALYGFGDEQLLPTPEEQEGLTTLKSFMSRVSYELSNPDPASGVNNNGGSKGPSPAHSPERSSTGGDGTREHIKTPTTAPDDDRRRTNSSGSRTGPRGRRARSSSGAPPSPVPDTAAAGTPAASGGGGGGESSLWPFRGLGDSPPRSRTNSSTGAQGLFSRQRAATRHPTPHAPLPMPPCMAAVPASPQDTAAKALDELLNAGSDSLWGNGGGSGEGGDDRAAATAAAAAEVEETMEWNSLEQRAVAVESCLFVLQVLKAARRRTIALGLLPASQRAAVDAYVAEVEQVTAQLRWFAYRAQATGLVGGDGIAAAAESQTWTRRNIRNDASPYVEKWIDRCLFIRRAIYPPPPPTRPSPPQRADGDESVPPSAAASETGTPTAASPSSASQDSAHAAAGGRSNSAAAAASASLGDVVGASSAGGGRCTPRTNGDGASGSSSSRTQRAGNGGGSRGTAAAAAATAADVVAHRVAAVPARARRLVWRGVVDALLLSLLKGFSRAPRCSTEGRALMSMDLQALALGLEDPSATQEVKAHVHAYVNAFYFGDEDLYKWIQERWRSYPMYQMVSLLQCSDGAVASKVLRKRRVKDLVAQVELLYLPWKEGGSGAGIAKTTAGASAGGTGAGGSGALAALEVGAVKGSNGAELPPSPTCE